MRNGSPIVVPEAARLSSRRIGRRDALKIGGGLAAVAAGEGMPDVIVEDRPRLKDRAANDIHQSLGDLAARDGVTGEAFWPFTWEEATTTEGVPYGLPYETDIRVLYYNKAAFVDAGLDPDTPPRIGTSSGPLPTRSTRRTATS